MILYNITTKIDPDRAREWIAWQDGSQIPAIMALGLFDVQEMFRLLEQDDSDGYTYIIQFRTADRDHYDIFCRDHRARFNQRADEKWSGHFVSFQTVMELVQ